MRQQQIIIKVAERCNINCTYCYYFEGNKAKFKSKPALLVRETISGLSEYLHKSFTSGEVDRTQLIFHGGEPLLIGTARFDEMCSFLRAAHSTSDLEFCLQTNATLISDKWIDLFEKYDVKVCTSLDGPEQVHDANRVDHKGRGSYAATMRGISLLLEALQAGRITSVACLSVIQPQYSGKEAYRHIVNELGFRQLDFLFPDVTHSDFCGDARTYGRFLIEVFDEWIEQDSPAVNVRILQSIMAVLMGGKSYLAGFGSGQPNAFTVRSDGQVELDDFLRTCGIEQINTNLHISDLEKSGIRGTTLYSQIDSQFGQIPKECRPCPVVGACRGGQITHRFHKDNGFSNPSVFCDGLFDIFVHVAKKLLKNGVPRDQLTGLSYST